MSTNNSSQKGLPWNTMVDLDKLTVRLIPYNGRNLLTWAAFLNQECIDNISLEIHPGKKLKFIDGNIALTIIKDINPLRCRKQ